MLKRLREEDGFTLLEMAIVILIVAALLLIVIPNVGNVSESVDETTDDALKNTVETQAVIYEIDDDTEGAATLEALEGAGYISPEQSAAYEEEFGLLNTE